jgi:hypothetical protein
LKGNVVKFYLTLREDEPKPYEPKFLLLVDLNEDSMYWLRVIQYSWRLT